jgi:hypothetical protein
VTFEGSNGDVVTDNVSAYFVDPSYNGNSNAGGDLAVLRLANPAPSFATEYSIYTGAMPTGEVLMAGYGLGGTGMTGGSTSYGTLLAGINEYVENGKTFSAGYSAGLYIGQFYDPNIPSTNALNVANVANAYDYTDEVDIAAGDSGGPSFYNDEIVGIHDIGICYSVVVNHVTQCTEPPSVSTANYSFFGQMFGDVSAEANATWIDDQETPEPGSLGLLGLGLAVLAAFRFLRRARVSGALLRSRLG